MNLTRPTRPSAAPPADIDLLDVEGVRVRVASTSRIRRRGSTFERSARQARRAAAFAFAALRALGLRFFFSSASRICCAAPPGLGLLVEDLARTRRRARREVAQAVGEARIGRGGVRASETRPRRDEVGLQEDRGRRSPRASSARPQPRGSSAFMCHGSVSVRYLFVALSAPMASPAATSSWCAATAASVAARSAPTSTTDGAAGVSGTLPPQYLRQRARERCTRLPKVSASSALWRSASAVSEKVTSPPKGARARGRSGTVHRS